MTDEIRHETAQIAPDVWFCPWCGRKIIWDENGRRVLVEGNKDVVHFGMSSIHLEPEPVVVRK